MECAARFHELFQANDLRQLVELGRKLTTNPIILTDLTHKVLEMSEEPELTDPKWLEIRTRHDIPLNQAVSNRYRESMDRRRPILDETNPTPPILRTAIAQAGQLIGFLEIPCYYGVPDAQEQDVIMFLADVACLIMKRDLRYMDTPDNMRDFFICDLLEGRETDERLIRERCRQFNWELSGFFRVASICWEKDAPPQSRTAMEQHMDSLKKQFPAATIFIYGNELKLIVPMQEDVAVDGRFFDDLIDYLKAHRLQGGISRKSDQLSRIGLCNQEAGKALELGRMFSSREILFFYDKYSIYHCMEYCAAQVDLMQFCHSAIFTLVDYDRTHETALLETLHAYLYSHRNLAEAAAKLYIHRNTFNNRLAKINDLIHVDLEDSETVFHLMFSYHILEYYGATVEFDYEHRMKLSPTLRHQ